MESPAERLCGSECRSAVIACLVTRPQNFYYTAVVPESFNYSCISHSKCMLGEELIKKMYPAVPDPWRLCWKGGEGGEAASLHSHILGPATHRGPCTPSSSLRCCHELPLL